MREMKVKVRNVGARLNMNGMGWAMVACLFADNTVLFAESEEEITEWWMNFIVYVREGN